MRRDETEDRRKRTKYKRISIKRRKRRKKLGGGGIRTKKKEI